MHQTTVSPLIRLFPALICFYWLGSQCLAFGAASSKDMVGEPLAAKRAATGERKLGVLLLRFSDDDAPAYDQQVMEDLLTDANGFFEEASYGQLSFSWDIFGPLNVPMAQPCTQDEQLLDAPAAAEAAAAQAGIDLSGYETIVFAGSGCGPARGRVDGAYVWLLQPGLGSRTVAHELGHSLGLLHADRLACHGAPYIPFNSTLVKDEQGCLQIDAGDAYDVMGSDGYYHFNAIHKETLGWLTAQEVTQSGVYQIEPIERAESVVKALKIVPDDGEPFYLEYRRPIGFDRLPGTTAGWYKGPLIHVWRGSTPVLLMMGAGGLPLQFPGAPPTINSLERPALLPGMQYVDPENRFVIETLAADDDSAQVRITLTDAEEGPSFSFGNPLGGRPIEGEVLVTLVPADPDEIAEIELYRDGQVLGKQSGDGSAVYEFEWDTALESRGAHRLTAIASDHGGARTTRFIDISVHQRPELSLIVPNASVTFGQQVTLIAAQVSVDEESNVDEVSFLIDGPSESLRLPAGIALPNNTYSLDWLPSERGLYVVHAEVTDKDGFFNWIPFSRVVSVADTAIWTNGVVNAADFLPVVSPGMLFSIFGGGFSAGSAAASQLPLPYSLADASVTVNGIPAPLLFVSPGQINAQAPWALEAACQAENTNIDIAVETANGVAHSNAQCSPLWGAVFLFNEQRQAVAINPDGSIAAPQGSIEGRPARPAREGETILVFGTGFGPITPAAVDGHSSMDALRRLVHPPTVEIGGIATEVSFAGLSPEFVGLVQLNVIVPAGVEHGDRVELNIDGNPLQRIAVGP